MPKTLVFCADGTWNGPDGNVASADADGCAPAAAPGCSVELTNVCKLFAWLAGELQPVGTAWGEAEMAKVLAGPDGQPAQLARYVHGVGTAQELLDKVAGGAFGVGVTARIAAGYAWLSSEYVPGDRIVIVGFSRGAYTARALAGLVAGEGLLRPDLLRDPAHVYDIATAAWYRWRRGRDSLLQVVLDDLTEVVEMKVAIAQAATLTADSFVPATVTAVAVWDTVGALGIPTNLDGREIDLYRFCDTALNSKIGLGLHALALDEERDPFQPTLWDDAPHVTQAIFPGGHCDVGGGYPEHGLSDGPLQWIVSRLQQPDVGLQFNAQPPVAVTPDPFDWRHRAWVQDPLWEAAGVSRRAFRPGMEVDASVRQRMNGEAEHLFDAVGNTAPYAPDNLPG